MTVKKLLTSKHNPHKDRIINTVHSLVRDQQRGIPPMMVDLLLQFGTSEQTETGVTNVFFDKQSRKRVAVYAGSLVPLLDEHLDWYAVVGPDMKVITVGRHLERIRRH
jgi:hypothetical protein